MKLMIASDLHGSSYWCTRMLEAYKKEQPDRLIFLGDILYHGPRNDLPKEYAAEGGFELGFSAQRALGRNRFIHAMGEKTLVAQTGFGKGGTWSGSLDNLQHEYSPLFVFDDGSEGARALCARGATPVQALTSLQALTPAQLSFDMQ